MMVPNIDTVADWRGRRVVGSDGQAIGTFKEIYLDEDTDLPTWAAVGVGSLGIRRRLVPLMGAEPYDEAVRVPFDKRLVKSAPRIDPDGWVSGSERLALYRHYGLSEAASSAELPDAQPPAEPVETEPEAASGRMRLRRYVVTETVRKRSEYTPDA